MTRLRSWLWRAWPLLLGAGVLLVAAAEAEGRVGGGQSFGGGGGGRSFGGGGSYGGGGGGEADAIFLLLELCIRYPKLGIPLLGMFLLFLGVQHLQTRRNKAHRIQVRDDLVAKRSRPARSRPSPGLHALRRADPGFSVPPLKDFVVLLHRRALEAACTQKWDPLVPWVDSAAQKQLVGQLVKASDVREVVAGGVRIEQVEQRGRFHHLVMFIESSRVEVIGGRAVRVRVEERLGFRRAKDAISLEPDAMRRLGCPNCGVSIETTRMGACPNCDTAITGAQLQWQLTRVEQSSRRLHTAPAVGRLPGGKEPGYDMPTVQSLDLPAQMRKLQARHPEFSPEAFGKRAADIYFALQTHWSEGRWENARPWVTDSLFQSLRFWIEQHTAHGLRNRLEDVELHKVSIVKVGTDAWYESIVVRIHGAMKDSMEDSHGRVVGGNADNARWFSEYWTFIRAVGTGGTIHDAHSCPSCGAPLDQIGQTGVCGYCSSKITTGDFDWVLSGIEQPESYNGNG